MDGPLYKEMPNVISILTKAIEEAADLSTQLSNKDNLILAVRNNIRSELGELYWSLERVLKNSSSLSDEALDVIK